MFEVAADSYDRFMGRYSVQLAPQLADLAEVRAVQQAPAEDLPYADASFDAALAQLVVHFMTDAVAGLTEMARVTRPGGVVAACVWDDEFERSPLSPFW